MINDDKTLWNWFKVEWNQLETLSKKVQWQWMK